MVPIWSATPLRQPFPPEHRLVTHALSVAPGLEIHRGHVHGDARTWGHDTTIDQHWRPLGAMRG